jgi:4-amino-4-deoxy-L-arabinose transferase-like glycosyltransferase
MIRERPGRLWLPALLVLLGLAAANFLWQLGSSSYYVDEVLARGVALHPLSGLLGAIADGEIAPPAYFAGLHEWFAHIGTGPEWVARLPSALCGIALVAAVYWLALLLCGRRSIALGAAALAALSPFTLEYAQRAQEYVFVMLASTIAIAATVQAERAADGRQRRWLVAGAAGSVLSILLHYAAALVVLPLCVWVATRSALTPRARAAYVGACAVAGAALVPLFVVQHGAHPDRAGVADTAGVTATNFARMLETPFDGRVDALRLLGVAVTVAALAAVLARGRQVLGERWLVVSIAAGGLAVLILLSLFGLKLMLTRYAAPLAPLLMIVIVAGAASLPRPLAALLAAAAVVVALAGLRDSHRVQGFNLNARGIIAYIRARERPGDAVLEPPNPGTRIVLDFYGLARLHPALVGQPDGSALVVSRRHRLWLIQDANLRVSVRAGLAYGRPLAAALGYRIGAVRIFPADVPLGVVELIPRDRRSAR